MSAKYSPIDVALWIEQCVEQAEYWLKAASRTVKDRNGSVFRRIEEDVLIQIGLGTFFARKLRSAVLYQISQHSPDADTGRAALEHYRRARDAWATMAERAKSVYRANISYGSIPKRSGHWIDRLPAIDIDIAAMTGKVERNNRDTGSSRTAAKMAEGSLLRKSASKVKIDHTPPEKFKPGKSLALKLVTSTGEDIHSVRGVRLCYRHVDQAERWNAVDAVGKGGVYTAAIPAEYTQSKFALEYYFELRGDKGVQWTYPGFNKDLSNQPYFAVCKRAESGGVRGAQSA